MSSDPTYHSNIVIRFLDYETFQSAAANILIIITLMTISTVYGQNYRTFNGSWFIYYGVINRFLLFLVNKVDTALHICV